MRSHQIAPADVAIVGFHGQTVLHKPETRLTVQIGDGAALAKALGIAVAYDFRAADVAAGGQGAPIVPVFHRAIAQDLDRPGPLAVLNIGGVANVTYVDAGSDPVACDTGPGNALIDDFMRAHTGKPLDRDGDMAAEGQGRRDLRRACAGASVFRCALSEIARPQRLRLRQFGLPTFSVEDGAATLTALTAAVGGAHRAASAEAAAHLDRRRRRRA